MAEEQEELVPVVRQDPVLLHIEEDGTVLTREGPIVAHEEAPEEGPPPEAPVLSGIEPSSLPITDPDTEVTVSGTGFTENSVIVWNGGDEPTNFIDAEHVSTLVKPSTAEVEPPFSLPVTVRNGSSQSNEVTFTFS